MSSSHALTQVVDKKSLLLMRRGWRYKFSCVHGQLIKFKLGTLMSLVVLYAQLLGILVMSGFFTNYQRSFLTWVRSFTSQTGEHHGYRSD